VDHPVPTRLPDAEEPPCLPLGRDSDNSTHLDGRTGHTAHHYGHQRGLRAGQDSCGGRRRFHVRV
jgi:hypothetical protein